MNIENTAPLASWPARAHRGMTMTDDARSPLSLALAAAPLRMREPLRTLFDLDRRLGDIVRTTREPLIGQMRLTWWHDALIRLDEASPPAEPLLRDIQQHLLPAGISGHRLALMIDGWEDLLLADIGDDHALDRHLDARGEGLFAIAAALAGGESPLVAPAGRAWAAADVAAGLSDPAAAAQAAHHADQAWSTAFSASWPASLRPVGAISLITMLDRDTGTPIGKALRLMRFRTFGR